MRSALYALVSVTFLAGGFYLQFRGGNVSDADKGRCEQRVRSVYGDNPAVTAPLLPECRDPGMVAMMDARIAGAGAKEAAAAISAANANSLLNDLMGYALIGAGIGGLGAACLPRLRQRRGSAGT